PSGISRSSPLSQIFTFDSPSLPVAAAPRPRPRLATFAASRNARLVGWPVRHRDTVGGGDGSCGRGRSIRRTSATAWTPGPRRGKSRGGSLWFAGEHLDHGGVAAVQKTLGDVALDLLEMEKLEALEILPQDLRRVEKRGVFRATRAVAELVGGVGLEQGHAAGPRRLDHAAVGLAAQVGGKVAEDQDHRVPCPSLELVILQARVDRRDLDAALLGELSRLGQAHGGGVDPGDPVAEAGEEDAVSALAF